MTKFLNKEELLLFKGSENRLMGLDVGSKTIGVALSDTTWFIGSPFTLIQRTSLKADLEKLQRIITNNKVSAVVIGYPLNLNGTIGPQAEKVKNFADVLLSSLHIPLFLWDERLSTVAVTRTLLEADMSRKRRSQVVDKMAATFILQGVLDLLNKEK